MSEGWAFASGCRSEAAGGNDAAGIEAAVAALSDAERRDFFALSQCAKHGAAKTAVGIWGSNAYPADSAGNTNVSSHVYRLTW